MFYILPIIRCDLTQSFQLFSPPQRGFKTLIIMTQTLFSVILTGFCASYSNDDDSNGDFRNDLNGNWEMTSYFSFLPTLPDIADGDII